MIQEVLFNRLYYNLKPILPSALRIAVRRSLAKRKRLTHAGTWPINPVAGSAPESWPGWPAGKRFALVLTHDVERQEGLDRCRQLMELEMRLGLCSSFNFVPEGNYSRSKELRDLLSSNGFEVGVHDLRHDGKLYASRAEFKANAQRINRYLKEWNAVGFRSGLMHHNLDWLRDLRALYDSSTFDTDPFEPQPDGVSTIFPFWVQGRNGAPGYVELPYTLPQDFTLFILLREKTIDIWKRKLDWIAERGGMALLIVHPDYMCFGDDSPTRHTYPAILYREFIEWVKQKYAGQYWQAFPKDVAVFCRQTRFGNSMRIPKDVARCHPSKRLGAMRLEGGYK